MDNWKVSYGDLIIIDGVRYCVMGGDRSDHYQHYIFKDSREIQVTDLDETKVKIIKAFPYVVDKQRMYEGESIFFQPKDGSMPVQVGLLVYKKEYPYFYVRDKEGIEHMMHETKFAWKEESLSS